VNNDNIKKICFRFGGKKAAAAAAAVVVVIGLVGWLQREESRRTFS